MKRLIFFVGAVAGLTILGSLISAPTESMRLQIDLQETQATVTARWYYSPPPDYETWYEWVVVNEAAGDTIRQDSTSLQTAEVTIRRAEVDMAYRFAVRVWIRDALGQSAPSSYVDMRFLIPSRPAAVLLAKRDMVTAPVVIPNDPAFEQERGTLWLEFETTDDITTTQGLWSRDASGYQGGGHLTVLIRNGSVEARVQSDSASYVVLWPVVANARNQVAVEFGDDTGFRLHVNGAIAGTDPYTGGTVGNSQPVVVGANQWDWAEGRPDYTEPFSGTVRVSEFYAGRYDFSGRWGLPPITPPPPVDSLAIEVARIDHGQVVPQVLWENQPTYVDYFSINFTPIKEAAFFVRYVDGDTLETQQGKWLPALLPVAGGEWHVTQSDASGWRMYNERTGALCTAPASGWTVAGTTPCITRSQMIAMVERNNDCVGGRYFAKHQTEIACYFNLNIAHHVTWNFPRGTNPVLRLEAFDVDRRRIGYWERRVS